MSGDTTAEPAAIVRSVGITNQKGLHARAAAKLAQMAGQFQAEITVSRADITVSALSIMGLMMLAAGPGMEIELSAMGADAQIAVDSIAALVTGGFGEELSGA
jgi:phosphocarrier protein HPr